MFKIKISIETEIGVKKEISNEIPVIPPSIKPFGIRKLLRPKPAISIPKIIKKNSFINIKIKLYTLFISEYTSINL